MVCLNIREIADLAGVSVATVSRCLNQPEKVAPKTLARIRSIMEQKDYSPNPSAQSLSTGCTKTVACVVPTLKNEYFNQLAEGCQSALAAIGYRMLIYTMQGDASFWEKLDQRHFDGMIVSGVGIPGGIGSRLDKFTVPFVIIDHPEELGDRQDISTVYVQDEAGIGMALSHFYEKGNRSFGILTGSESDTSALAARRIRAAEDFFRRHTDCSYAMEHADYTDLTLTEKACERLLEKDPRPTAIFAFNDMIAAGALRCLLKRGISVPGEIEVIGFDNIPLSSFFTPSLSTISAPNRKLGEKAVDLLLGRLQGDTEPSHLLYPVELLLRESTRP